VPRPMCDLTILPGDASARQPRPPPERSPVRTEDELAGREAQPNPSPVFDKHVDSPDREAGTVTSGVAAGSTSAAASSVLSDDESKTATAAPPEGAEAQPSAAAADEAGDAPGGDNHLVGSTSATAAAAAAASAATAAANASVPMQEPAAPGAPKRSATAMAETAADVRPIKTEGAARVAPPSGPRPAAGKKPRHDAATVSEARAERTRPKSGDQLLTTSLLARHIPAANSAAQVRQWFSQFGEVTAVMLIGGQGHADEVQALVTFGSQDQCDQARARCLETIAALRQQSKQPTARKAPAAAATAAADVDMAGIIRQAVTHMHECGIDTDLWPIRHNVQRPRPGAIPTQRSADTDVDRKRKQSDKDEAKLDLLKSDPWSEQETARLLEAAHRNRRSNWPKIARYVGRRSEDACRHRFSTVLRHDPQRVEAAALMMSGFIDSSEDDEESVSAPKRVKLVVGSKPSSKSSRSPTQTSSSTDADVSLPWTPKEDAELAKIVRARASQAQAAVSNDWAEIALQLNTAVKTGTYTRNSLPPTSCDMTAAVHNHSVIFLSSLVTAAFSVLNLTLVTHGYCRAEQQGLSNPMASPREARYGESRRASPG
jgi:hypothetical protein